MAGPSLSLRFFADSPLLMSLFCPSFQLAELPFITAHVLLGQVMWLELGRLLRHVSPTPGVRVHCLQNPSARAPAPQLPLVSPAARAHLSSSELFKRVRDWDDGREGRPLPREWVGQWSLAVSIPHFLFSCSSFCFSGHAARTVGSSFPTQGLNLRCPQRKHGVLTPGLPGKSSWCLPSVPSSAPAWSSCGARRVDSLGPRGRCSALDSFGETLSWGDLPGETLSFGELWGDPFLQGCTD